MCGRYAVISNVPRIAARLGVGPVADGLPDDTGPRYNAAPGQWLPVVRSLDDRFRIDALRWGLLPHWAREATLGTRLINARCETASEKPAFRHAFRHRRCLVPVDGFYEWQRLGTGRQPWFIHRRDREPLFLAGLWECNQHCGETIETFTILTTIADHRCTPIHPRMPVIVDRQTHARWFDGGPGLLALLTRCAEVPLDAYPVSSRVNRATHDDPRCIEPSA